MENLGLDLLSSSNVMTYERFLIRGEQAILVDMVLLFIMLI